VPKENDERLKLSKEVKELFAYIASLRHTWNRLEVGPEKISLLRK
jgi:hypothetical protein